MAIIVLSNVLIMIAFVGILQNAVVCARPPPVVPQVGAVASGNYRNMFVEAGYSKENVTLRLKDIVHQLFFGNPANESLFFAATDGSDSSYIFDVGDNDVRTEGMGYGLMATLQLNMPLQFDRLFRWYKHFMQHTNPTDTRYGYSSWHCQTSGASMDNNPASDGETFIVSSLFFAAARWGDHGAINYTAEAQLIIHAMISKENPPCGIHGCDSVVNMFGGAVADNVPAMVVFVPYASAASYTDPSYHTPFFYEQWALRCNTSYWKNVSATSRAFFHLASHPQTALTPDYATFAGAPTGGHESFSFDAWRTARNVAVDYAWYAADPAQIALSNKILTFFRGLPSWPKYGNQFTLDGRQTDGDHSPGLVAMNAVAALGSNLALAWDFVDQLWATATPSGQWRYYDGLLYLEAWLHLSGNYRAYG